MELKTELSREEMRAIFAKRVRALYGMTVGQYVAARKNGTLPEHPGSTALEVFSGEAGSRKPENKGKDSLGGQRTLSRVYSKNASLRRRNGSVVRGPLSTRPRSRRHPRTA